MPTADDATDTIAKSISDVLADRRRMPYVGMLAATLEDIAGRIRRGEVVGLTVTWDGGRDAVVSAKVIVAPPADRVIVIDATAA